MSKLTDLTQEQLAQVIAYERANRKRATVIERAQSLQENEPFPGYDDLTAREIAQRVARRRRGDGPAGARLRGAPPAPRRGPRGRLAPAQRIVVMTGAVLEIPGAAGPDRADRPGRPHPARGPRAGARGAGHAGRPRRRPEPDDPLPPDPDGPSVPPPDEELSTIRRPEPPVVSA